MKYAEQFVESLRLLNAFVFHRSVLKYQQEIIQGGSFSLVSPWSGARLAPTACHIANNGDPAHGNIGIAYRVGGESVLWLLAGSTKDGFPITEAYLPLQNTSIWSLSEAHFEENKQWKTLLRDVEQELGQGLAALELTDTAQQAPVVLMGHPNFAHHLWNELPALHAYTLARDAGAPMMHIRTLYQPIAPIEEFVNGVAVSVHSIDDFDELVGVQSVLVTRLGSTQIPRELRSKVVDIGSCRANHPAVATLLERLRECSPVIWLSLRLDARTLDNETEFISALVKEVCREYPRAGFILDGFSYPNDFGDAIYREGSTDGFLASSMKTREREISKYAQQIQASLITGGARSVINLSGLGLGDAIFIARIADYYVCHAGTLQHKVAWVYNIDGLVHSNTAGVQKGAQKWLADQLQGGVIPELLAGHLVQDLDSIRTFNKVDRNRDYHIIDVKGAVAQVLASLTTVLS